MTPSWVNRFARSIFARAGIEIRYTRKAGWGTDAFLDQVRLLESAPVEVVVDGGANVGDTVEIFHRLFPGADIHAFEPFEPVFARLADRYASVPQVHPHRAALADAAGVRRLHVFDDHPTNSLLPADPAPVDWSGTQTPVSRPQCVVEVPVTTLDQFCAQQGLPRIDLLKLDIQGGEVLALGGAEGLLRAKAIRVIYAEVLFAPFYAGQAYFADVAALLASRGYQLFGLYNLVQGEPGLAWADAIFRPF